MKIQLDYVLNVDLENYSREEKTADGWKNQTVHAEDFCSNYQYI